VKLVHQVGFIIKKSVTMHGHMNVKKMRGLMLIRNFLIKKTQEINSYVYVSKS